jgi:hypothetical protein
MPLALTEAVLHRRSLCSMYQSNVEDHLTGPAERTFRWALKERFIGKLHKPADLREHFVSGWSKAWNLPEKDARYWEGPNKSRAFGRHVYEFLLKYEIVQPYEPYSLELPAGTVTGENAIAIWKSRHKGEIPQVVSMRIRRPRDLRVPFYPALAQWVASREAAETVDLGLLTVPVLGDRYASTGLNEALARTWLNAIVKEAADNTLFPRYGTQCVTCSHPCKEVLRGPDDDSWN